MKFLLAMLAGFAQLFSFSVEAEEFENRQYARAGMKINQFQSGKTATTYLRTSETPDAPKAKWKINQALSGKTATVYVRVPQ